MYQAGGIEQFCAGHNPFPGCIESISRILADEGYRRNHGFNEETALDLDAVEIRSHNNERDMTFDFVVAIQRDKLLLTEAKLRITDMTKNTVSNIIEKVDHSKDILVSCPNFNSPYKVHDKMVVLIPDAKFQTNRNKFHRFMQEKRSKLKIDTFTVSDFYSNFIIA